MAFLNFLANCIYYGKKFCVVLLFSLAIFIILCCIFYIL